MPVPANISDSTAINASMDQEFIRNFEGDLDRLLEVLGIFGAETIAAGTTLKMLKVAGELNNSKTAGSKESATGDTAVQLGSSSGTAYVEGDEVALSKFTATYEPVGEAEAGTTSAAAATNCAARCGCATSLSCHRSSSRFSVASFAGPDQRAEKMPGDPPSTSTEMPESSASAGSPVCSAAARALRSALASKLRPVSRGSGPP